MKQINKILNKAKERFDRYKYKVQFNIKNKKEKKFELFESSVNKGERLYNLGLYSEALKEYENADALSSSLPADVEVSRGELDLRIAHCHHRLGKHDTAIVIARNSINSNPEDPRAYFLIGCIYLDKSGMNTAKEYKAGEDPFLFQKWLVKRRKLKHIKKAKEYFEKNIKVDKKHAPTWYFLGICYYFLKQAKGTIDCFDLCLLADNSYNPELFKLDLFYKIKNEKGFDENINNVNYLQDKKYKTKRGVLVRSKAELIIDNFYFDNNIQVQYEPLMVLGDVKLHPDFKLVEVGIIHEHLGSDQSKQAFEKRRKIYDAHGVKYIATFSQDEADIEAALKEKLSGYYEFD